MATTNYIETITKYSPDILDKVYKREAISSLFDARPGFMKFTGAKTVKIAKMQFTGMSDYYRNSPNNYAQSNQDGADPAENPQVPPANLDTSIGGTPFGYTPSPSSVQWEEFVLKVDRQAAIPVEKFDDEESGEIILTNSISEYQRTQVAPEMDAYVFSEIAKHAGTTITEDITADGFKPISALNTAFEKFDDYEIPQDGQIAFVSSKMLHLLRETPELVHYLRQEDFNKNVTFKMTRYEDRDIVMVPPSRFKTNVILGKGGFYYGANSKDINYMLVSKEAVYHAIKFEQVKIISGDLNLAGQGFDGFTLFVRLYHDVFVPDNKKVAIYVSVAGTAKAVGELKVGMTAGLEVTDISYTPADLLLFTMKIASASAPKVGDIVGGTATALNVGDQLAKDASNPTYAVAVDSYKRIKVVTKILEKA